jgi:AcrR family transcriptional regulator
MPDDAVKQAILETAIRLFGERGYDGVTTKTLAKAAGVNEGSIYNHYESKDDLYRKALREIISHSGEALGKMLLGIHTGPHSRDVRQFLTEVVHAWYLSIPQPAARFLQQVMIADQERGQQAYQPIAQIINIMVSALREKSTGKSPSHMRDSAETLVSALFQRKVMRLHILSEQEEMERIDAKTAYWLDGMVNQH